MYDFSELKGLITRFYESQRKFAKAIKKTDAHVTNVLNGSIIMRQSEVSEWVEALQVEASDIGRVFFTKKGSRNDNSSEVTA